MKNEIIVCENRLLQAQKECDIEVMNELLHNDLLFNGPGGVTITKDMDLAVYESGNMIVDDIIASEQQINFFGDTAVVTVTLNIKGAFMKQPINNKARFIRIWKNIDEQWKVIGGASSFIE